MTLSEYFARYIYSQGVDCLFEMIGGMSVRLIDAVYQMNKTKIISVHHEQSAAFAACGWAQSKNIPGVAVATSGPGATNLVTGIATCYFDSIPAVFITGQVNQCELSCGTSLRQLGFQEMDVVSVVKPITKYAVQLQNAQDITKILPDAFRIAKEGRHGPVLIDIPMNLQKDEIQVSDENYKIEKHPGITVNKIDSAGFCDQINEALQKSKAPLFLLGGGVVQSQTKTLVHQLVEKIKIPAVYSLHGKGILPSNCEYSVGLIGSYGNRWANKALADSDLLIVLGSRLDIRQTGADTIRFSSGKKIFQIDIDPAELGNRVKNTLSLSADLASVMPTLLTKLNLFDKSEWLQSIEANMIKWPDTKELENISGINPNAFLKKLGMRSNINLAGFVTDVGANQIWSAQSLYLHRDQFFMTSGSMGSMGYALPTAIGASIAHNNAGVAVIAGDGGFQCNIQELELIRRLNLPVKIIILNNHSLGMVKQFQWEYFDCRYPGTVTTYGAPDFIEIGNAYGIPSRRISEISQIEEALKWFIFTDGPLILDADIDINAGVLPKMQFGHGLDDMMPLRS